MNVAKLTTYDSAARPHPFWEEAREAYRYRDLVFQLVSRDIKTRYKRSVLGIAWTMLHPLLMMAVLALVFSNIFRSSLPHYPVYVLAGLVCWNFIAQTTTTTSAVTRAGVPLMNKVYVPRTIFALAVTGTGMVNLGLSLIPLLAIAAVTGVALTWSLMWLIPAMFLSVIFVLGLSLLVSILAVPFPDVVEMFQVLLTAWYFLTPIIYPESMVSPELRGWLVLNPVYHLVRLFRDPVHAGQPPAIDTIVLSAIGAVAMLIIGWFAFSTKAENITDRV